MCGNIILPPPPPLFLATQIIESIPVSTITQTEMQQNLVDHSSYVVITNPPPPPPPPKKKKHKKFLSL
jgi:hypothetical protein